jgi:hypothetical protein
MAVVLVEHHSQQLEEQRISSFACRTQAWLGIFEDVDILLGMPNIGYSFFLMERCRLHHPCTMDVFDNQQHFVANHRHEFLRCIEDHQCKTVLSRFRSSKSNTLCKMFRVRIFHRASHSAQC